MVDLNTPTALVFDLDGALIDSAAEIRGVGSKVFNEKGLKPSSVAVVCGAIGNGVGVLVSRLLQSQGQEPSGPLRAELVAEFVRIYEEALDLTKLYPGVAEVLSGLANAGHPMGIRTNKPAGPACAVLRHSGLSDFLFRVALVTRQPSCAQARPGTASGRCVCFRHRSGDLCRRQRGRR